MDREFEIRRLALQTAQMQHALGSGYSAHDLIAAAALYENYLREGQTSMPDQAMTA